MFNKNDKDMRLVDAEGYMVDKSDHKTEEQTFLDELSAALQEVDNAPREMPPLIKEDSVPPIKQKNHII